MESKTICDEVGFIDISTKKVYLLLDDTDFIVSDTAVETSSNKVLVIPPAIEGESYVLRITGNPPSLHVIYGKCNVNGKPLLQPSLPLSPGTFVTLGSARSLQYTSSGYGHHTPPVRRVLPPTPGKAVDPLPPSKPRRRKQQQQCLKPAQPNIWNADAGIRPRLQRIAAEVSARLLGYEDRKPPPPYEQVGNSIGYQLLHQQQHKMVSSELIDSLYPALKENELKDSSLVETYTAYLKEFQLSLEKPASIQCMLPADLPTCDFVVDILLHLCCMPHMTCLAEKQGSVWCQLLALFSQSQQNQVHMASKRHPTKVLSCMHLNIMASKVRFQQYGWTVLANTVAIPTPPGGKPVLSESSLTLALSMAESQIAAHSSDLQLVVAIVDFLSRVASAAKVAISHTKKQDHAYTEEQAIRVLELFREKYVLRHVMKVPPHLRSESSFEQAYSSLVKALVPVRGQSAGSTLNKSGDKEKKSDPTPDSSSLHHQKMFSRSISEHWTNTDAESVALTRVASDSDLLSLDKPNKSDLAANSSSESDDVQYTNSGSDVQTDIHSAPRLCNGGGSDVQTDIQPAPQLCNNDEVHTDIHSATPQTENKVAPEVCTNGSPLLQSQQTPSSNDINSRAPLPSGSLDYIYPYTASLSTSLDNNEFPLKDADSPDSPPKDAASPLKDAASPLKDPDSPLKDADSPLKDADSPPKDADSPPKDAASPPKDAASPLKDAASPLKDAASPLKDPDSPLKDTDSPPKDADSPPKDAASPLKDAASPLKDPDSPLKDAASPLKDPDSPLKDADSPPKDAASPLKDPDSPIKDADSPLKDADTPLKDADSPLKDTDSPLKDADSPLNATTSLYEAVSTTSPVNNIATSPTSSPPLTPNTANLAADVRELLDTLHTPLDPAAASNIRVPTLSRYNRYYRHSYKKTSVKLKQSAGAEHSMGQDSDISSLSGIRLHWGQGIAYKSLMGHKESDMFEVSGQYLSTQHSAMEEVISGHSDVLLTLQSRVELLESVLALWAKGKGLQAVTNLLQGCFSDNCVNDVQLFVDTLHCFLCFQSSWTLAVCLVLLPTLRQLMPSQTSKENVKVLGDAILMIVHRFSDLILACKVTSKRKSRLSAAVDKEQQLVCYRELHSIQHELHEHLNSNQAPVELADIMRKVHAALQPFKQPAT